jgi:transposase
MERKDIIRMSHKELKRLHIIHKVLCKKLKQREASRMLKVSDRQTRRIVKRVKEEGEGGIAHKSRGRRSNRAFPPKYKERVVHLYRETFPDFGPTLANEKLSEMYKIDIGTQTLRNWLIEDGAWSVKRERRKHRQWRERKQYYGEMEQIDGSHHDWFEGRGPGCVLMSYVDDAGGRVYARF